MMPEQVVMINWERHFLQNLSFLITILFFNILYIKVTSKKKNNYKKEYIRIEIFKLLSDILFKESIYYKLLIHK